MELLKTIETKPSNLGKIEDLGEYTCFGLHFSNYRNWPQLKLSLGVMWKWGFQEQISKTIGIQQLNVLVDVVETASSVAFVAAKEEDVLA